MSLKILIRTYPERSLALVTDSHALVFRYNVGFTAQAITSVPKSSLPRCMVESVALNTIDLSDYEPFRPQGVYGTLGLVNVNTDIFLCVITAATSVATVRSNEHVQRIVSVDFYCINKSEFDVSLHDEGGLYDDSEISNDGYDHARSSSQRDPPMEHPCLALKKLLDDGTFYYSVDFDLTNKLQDRSSEESAFDIDSLKEDFLWNSYMIDPLIQFRSRLMEHDRVALDAAKILTSAIRGYVSTMTIPAPSSPIKSPPENRPSSITLISRLSCRRAGTRFNARGIDDDGNVANFVETETVFWYPSGLCFSYAQIRGSVPVFWEQATGILPNQQKIQITRPPEATQPAFNKHFEDLELSYGTVHVLNLLSESKAGEIELTERYALHVRNSPLNRGHSKGESSDHRLLKASQFDFHAETKGANGYEAANSVRRVIQDDAEGFAYYLSNTVEDADIRNRLPMRRAVPVLQQEGIFRTNCLDCLDRTNLIQTIISQMALESFLRHQNEKATQNFWMRHSTLWADNGDALSKIYAGTGALKSSFTRHGKMSLAGAIADARKSATRVYINNFVDKGRQITIDTLLGRLVDQTPVQLYDPINDHVNNELLRRIDEYTTTEQVNIWVGTFNLNGRGHGVKEDLSAWLFPDKSRLQASADIVAVGFQEIVELSPQQIMSTDPARRQEWELAVEKALNENAYRRGSHQYVLLRSGQLVGAALMIFVKSTILKAIKNVEGSVKKTGLSGMAGNKGAVAIRIEYANTRICFVTAHLAAGFANYDERNRDYRTISHGLRFQRNRSIEDHDTILWLGDFNYRIGLGHEKVHRLIEAGDLGSLYQNDQLNLQMVAGQAFPYYSEASITFMPTYKYENGTDHYDTSEKARIPAWCDRVLYKGDNLKQINYNIAPLRFSDHRPVYATFECIVNIIDESKKQTLYQEIYHNRRSEVIDVVTKAKPDIAEDEELHGYKSIAPGLPPASSARQRWWLANGMPATSTIAEDHKGYQINSKRPSNPFVPSEEPDWIDSANETSSQILRQSDVIESTPNEHLVRISRKLPPPFDANRHLSSNIRHLQDGTRSADRPSPSRTPSLASTTSTSGQTRKAAPPVPRKPAVLMSSTDQKELYESTRAYHDANSRQSPSSSSVSRNASLRSGANLEFPPPPRRHTGPLQKVPNAPVRYNHQSEGKGRLVNNPVTLTDRPALPSRPDANRASNSGLLDEDVDVAQNIPSLKPLKPR